MPYHHWKSERIWFSLESGHLAQIRYSGLIEAVVWLHAALLVLSSVDTSIVSCCVNSLCQSGAGVKVILQIHCQSCDTDILCNKHWGLCLLCLHNTSTV